MFKLMAVVVNCNKNKESKGEKISQMRSIKRMLAVTLSEIINGLSDAFILDILFESRILDMLYQIKS